MLGHEFFARPEGQEEGYSDGRSPATREQDKSFRSIIY